MQNLSDVYPNWPQPEGGWQHYCAEMAGRVIGLADFHPKCVYGCGVKKPGPVEQEPVVHQAVKFSYESACGVNVRTSGEIETIDPRQVTCRNCLQVCLENEFDQLRRMHPKMSPLQYGHMKHLEFHLDRGDVTCKCYGE